MYATLRGGIVYYVYKKNQQKYIGIHCVRVI